MDLATLQAELQAFERRYLNTVGVRYAELDEIEAQIAKSLAQSNPQNAEGRTRAERARAQADESARATQNAKTGSQKFEPSASLKKVFRDAAKRFHPDLATEGADRARRTKLMSEINAAYGAGDEARLQQILHDWEEGAESIVGEGIGTELVRIIRKISQVEERLRVIEAQSARLKTSDLSELRKKVAAAEAEGRDLLAEMTVHVNSKISAARQRFAELTRKQAMS